MEYRIGYYWTAIGPGTFSADQQTLRLRGYSAARTRLRAWFIFCAFFFGLPLISSDLKTVLINIEALLGLPQLWWTGLVLPGLVGVGAYMVFSWPASTTYEEFVKRFVTRIGRREDKVSFHLPNPFKPGKFLHVKFKAKSIEEAEQIEQALRITEPEGAPQG